MAGFPERRTAATLGTWRLRAALPWRRPAAAADPLPPPAATPGESRWCRTTGAGAAARPGMRTSLTGATAAAALELHRQSPPLPPDGRHQEEALKVSLDLTGTKDLFIYSIIFFFLFPYRIYIQLEYCLSPIMIFTF